MIMNNGLSIKDKILNYLKKGVALATAAVTVIAASKTNAKAEGNSNIPNPTNIEEQTNTPIPSAGEDIDIEEEKELTDDFLDTVVDSAFASLKKYNISRTPYNEKRITKMAFLMWLNFVDKVDLELKDKLVADKIVNDYEIDSALRNNPGVISLINDNNAAAIEELNDYSGAAKRPVRCSLSTLSGDR